MANNSTVPAQAESYRYIQYGGRWVIETVRTKRFVGSTGSGENAKRDAAALVHAANSFGPFLEALREAHDRIENLTSGDRALTADARALMVRIEYLLARSAHVTE